MSGAVSKESFSRFPVHQCSFFDQYRGFDNSQRWLFVVKLRLRKIEFNRLESTIPTVRSDLHRERDRRLIAPNNESAVSAGGTRTEEVRELRPYALNRESSDMAERGSAVR